MTFGMFRLPGRRTNLHWRCYRSFLCEGYWWDFWSFTAAKHTTSCTLVGDYHHYESHAASICLGWGEDRSITGVLISP